MDEKPINYDSLKKVYMLGEKNTRIGPTNHLQNFKALRDDHLKNKTLFNDENFPIGCKILRENEGEVVWKRPFEISGGTARFINNEATRFDINQGRLKDCWFLSAVSNLTQNQQLFSTVVPPDQSFTENYAGIFHFRFWYYGHWVDVVVDDQLPTINDELIYAKSGDPTEFWPSLLEKAYAKLYGSYKNIESGKINEAFEDLFGGLSEVYEANAGNIHDTMQKCYEKSAFMGCYIATDDTRRRPDGLINSHVYSIIQLCSVESNNCVVNLIKLRNPWSGPAEWNGRCSDDNDFWNSIPEKTRDELWVKKDSGEFWMDAEDFQKCFTFVEICYPNPCLLPPNNAQNWNFYMFEDCWVPNLSSKRRPLDDKETYCHNPQYFTTVSAPEDKLGWIIVGLMQKRRREMGEKFLPLQLDLFNVPAEYKGKLLDKEFFANNEPMMTIKETGVRQILMSVFVPSGNYCVIPNIVQKNSYGSYLLRMYLDEYGNIEENDDEIGYSPPAISNLFKGSQSQPWLEVFKKISHNGNEIGIDGVRKALNHQFGEKRLLGLIKSKIEFSKETCKNILALWDLDHSGKLDLNEFECLMQDVYELQQKFKKYDTDDTGKLSGFDLRNILNDCGFKVNPNILTQLMFRYGDKGSMKFANLVVCIFKLKTIIVEFSRRQSQETTDHIVLNQKDLLAITLHL
ncbi:calpain-A [Tribolium castaneum]|uniref:Calpain-B-like Protein n=1 Tax=Tribolium castaneum TaxID=7070 RepID=A0A139WKR8_TRICA|nr:PREDICTED: calpain-A [Tribolium castaneum]KYB28411.1 Calpain-B-like Protein [Tribolium castaneum]|eukprot:XP_008194039.1 PREDICTED: calpain-A [Tribolium castaneum]